jgi:hypothetical protein
MTYSRRSIGTASSSSPAGLPLHADKRLLDRLHHASGRPRASAGGPPARSSPASSRTTTRSVSSSATAFAQLRLTSRCRGCASSTGSSKARPSGRRSSSDAGGNPDRADVRDLYARLLKTSTAFFHDGEWGLLSVDGAGDATSTTSGVRVAQERDVAIVAANITAMTRRDSSGRRLPEGDFFELKDRRNRDRRALRRGTRIVLRLGTFSFHVPAALSVCARTDATWTPPRSSPQDRTARATHSSS